MSIMKVVHNKNVSQNFFNKPFILNVSIIFFFFHARSKSYFLCQVTVTEDGLIKQRRLNDALNNLANRISLNGR